MEATLKKYFWVVQVLGLALAMGLLASAVVTRIGTRVALAADADPAAAVPEGAGEDGGDDEGEDEAFRGIRSMREPFAMPAGPRRKDTGRVSEAILDRNIFCPTCEPEPEMTLAAGQATASGAPVPAGEVKSSLPLHLMATMEAAEPRHSLATVYDAQGGTTGIYGVGDELRPSVVVVGVDTGVLHLRNNARLEYIELGEQVQPQRGVPSTPEPTSDPLERRARRASSREIPGAEEAINCPNENTCVVERQFVEKLMTNPAMLARQARIVPSQRDGETQGFKFYGIRRGSLPRMLGLKNGDMLTEVNGEELRSVDQAMALAMKLRRASNLSVTLVRKGQTITKEIQIQ